jgi:hypothetical protein
MADVLTGALKARGAFWLKCKKPLKMHFRGLLINSVVVRQLAEPRSEYFSIQRYISLESFLLIKKRNYGKEKEN